MDVIKDSWVNWVEWPPPPKIPTPRVNKKWGYKIRLENEWFESSALSLLPHAAFSKMLVVSTFFLPGREKTLDINVYLVF